MKEELKYRIVVRRMAIGSAPFGWEVLSVDASSPICVSSGRFSSMEVAYAEGQAWLTAFLEKGGPAAEKRAARQRVERHLATALLSSDAPEIRFSGVG